MKIVPSPCKGISDREEIEFIMSTSLENTDDSVVASLVTKMTKDQSWDSLVD